MPERWRTAYALNARLVQLRGRGLGPLRRLVRADLSLWSSVNLATAAHALSSMRDAARPDVSRLCAAARGRSWRGREAAALLAAAAQVRAPLPSLNPASWLPRDAATAQWAMATSRHRGVVPLEVKGGIAQGP